jgi:hypothetical protein
MHRGPRPCDAHGVDTKHSRGPNVETAALRTPCVDHHRRGLLWPQIQIRRRQRTPGPHIELTVHLSILDDQAQSLLKVRALTGLSRLETALHVFPHCLRPVFRVGARTGVHRTRGCGLELVVGLVCRPHRAVRARRRASGRPACLRGWGGGGAYVGGEGAFGTKARHRRQLSRKPCRRVPRCPRLDTSVPCVSCYVSTKRCSMPRCACTPRY